MMNLFIHCIAIEFWEFNQTYWQLHCSSHSFNAAGVDEIVAFDHDHDDHDHANKIIWIEWLVSRNHSRLGRHHHQPHRNIGHQNHNWDYLLLALVTTILIIIFFNSIMLIFYDAFRNHDSDHLFSWRKNAFTHWQLTQKRSGCRATADVRAQPALWLVAADCVVTASWVFVPNFSSISRSSRSQFAFWLLLSRRPILYQRFWWNRQNLHSYYCLSGIFEWNLSSQLSRTNVDNVCKRH